MTTRERPAIIIRHGTVGDAAMLSRLAATSFADTFAADNDARDMASYMDEAFGEQQQRAELLDDRLLVLIAECDGETAGYAVLREGPADDCIGVTDAIEVARLYADRRWIGAGVGSALMQACLDEAAARGRSTLWLGVWEHNARAIAFYRRWGFTQRGTHSFVLGRDHQTDHVMARPVATEG